MEHVQDDATRLIRLRQLFKIATRISVETRSTGRHVRSRCVGTVTVPQTPWLDGNGFRFDLGGSNPETGHTA